MDLADYTILETPEDAAKYVKRARLMGRYLDDHIANLRAGKSKGRVAARDAVQKTIDQLTRINATPADSLGIWKPAIEPHPSWSQEDRERFGNDLAEAIRTSLLPGIERYRAFLEKEILPVSRPPEHAGLADLPHGVDCYRKMIRRRRSTRSAWRRSPNSGATWRSWGRKCSALPTSPRSSAVSGRIRECTSRPRRKWKRKRAKRWRARRRPCPSGSGSSPRSPAR